MCLQDDVYSSAEARRLFRNSYTPVELVLVLISSSYNELHVIVGLGDQGVPS